MRAPRMRGSFERARAARLSGFALSLALLGAAPACDPDSRGAPATVTCPQGTHLEPNKGCTADIDTACPQGMRFEAGKGCMADVGAAAPSASSAASPPGSELVGTWTGKGCQKNGECWTIKVVIDALRDGRPVGTIAYPSLGCEARLEFTRWDGEDAVFVEQYTKQARCEPNGTVRLRTMDAKKTSYEWAHANGVVDAVTVLQREP